MFSFDGLSCYQINLSSEYQDGRLLCSSIPTYGEGSEAGNEAGYIVGMSTCYPQFGSVQISKSEVLVLESNYSRKEDHTGVMGLFYLLIADELPNSKSMLDHLSSSDKVRVFLLKPKARFLEILSMMSTVINTL